MLFLKDALSRSTIDGVLDGKKFAKIVDDLGSTKDVLFKSRLPRITGELEDLNELTSVLRSNATELDDSVIERIIFKTFGGSVTRGKKC